KNLRLLDLLDAIAKVAKPPLGQRENVSVKYSIEDYAIVFSERESTNARLFTRTFKVHPKVFRQGLEGMTFVGSPFAGSMPSQRDKVVGGGHASTETNQPPDLQNDIRNFFIAAGLEFPLNRTQESDLT